MKPEKPVYIDPKSKQFFYEIHAIAAQAGLIAECPEYVDILYWSDSKSKKRFRIGEDLRVQVSGNDFDRWALESSDDYKLPKTDEKFIKLICSLRS